MKPLDPLPPRAETSRERALREHRQGLNRKLRASFLACAEDRSRQERGRWLTDEELRRVMRRYPGDLPEE